MKNSDIFEALTDVDEKFIDASAPNSNSNFKRRRTMFWAIGIAAAVMIASIGTVLLINKPGADLTTPSASVLPDESSDRSGNSSGDIYVDASTASDPSVAEPSIEPSDESSVDAGEEPSEQPSEEPFFEDPSEDPFDADPSEEPSEDQSVPDKTPAPRVTYTPADGVPAARASAPKTPATTKLVFNEATKMFDGDILQVGAEDTQRRTNFSQSGDQADFYKKTVAEFLKGSNGENRVYSPVNVYFALAMLAETGNGSTSRQVLDLLGVSNLDQLREQTRALWLSNYIDDGVTKSLLGSSIWLDSDCDYNQEILDLLADEYFASTFRGKMGDDEYNDLLHEWINEQTGGFLSDQAKDINFERDVVFAIAATMYYKSSWHDEFTSTRSALFHSPKGDLECDLMSFYDYQNGKYYRGSNFTVAPKALESGSMWFILPDEGVSIDELLGGDEFISFISNRNRTSLLEDALLHLQVPKFDVASSMSLIESLKHLGVTDCFRGETADFTKTIISHPFDGNVYVGKINHDAHVAIDETGVEAAAVTVIVDYPDGDRDAPLVNLTCDRPFMFAITGDDGSLLFTGIVNDPTAK